MNSNILSALLIVFLIGVSSVALASCPDTGLDVAAEDMTFAPGDTDAKIIVNLNYFSEDFAGKTEEEARTLLDTTACHIVQNMLPEEFQKEGLTFDLTFVNLRELDEYGDLKPQSAYTQAIYSYVYKSAAEPFEEKLTLDKDILENPVVDFTQK